MTGMDSDYCLRRAEEERLRVEQAVSQAARMAHHKLRDLYLERADSQRPTLSIFSRVR
jgi:hypothetical protein